MQSYSTSFEPLDHRRLLHAEFAVSINFAPPGDHAPGMELDYGATLGVRKGGLTYGWNTDATADAVKRNVTSVKRNDSFIDMTGKNWSIDLPDGTYSVFICAGDPATFNDRMAITVDGQVTVSGITKSNRRYLSGTIDVNVTDGKLTLANAPWVVDDKLAYIAISTYEAVPPYLDITTSAPVASESTQTAGAFSITRGGSDDDLLDTPLTVPLTVGGTATNGTDYGKIGSSITFAAGISTITIPVHPVADNLAERNETVVVTLGSLKGFTAVESSATVTIQDAAPAAHTTLAWTKADPRPEAASEIWGIEVGTKLYTFGGFTDTSFKPSNKLYIYDTSTNTWSKGADLPVGITHVGIASDNSSIYFAGGYPGTGPDGNQTFSTTAVYRYNIAHNTYTALPDLPDARGASSMTLLNNVLYFVGGDNSDRQDVNTMWALDLGNLTAGWVAKAPAPAARNHAAFVTLDGSIYLIGGQTGQDANLVTQASTYRYDVSTNTWKTLASMPIGRSHISDATFIYKGKIVVLGGQSAFNTPLSSNLEYDPVTNVWSTIAAMPSARFSGVGGTINSTKFVYTGGYDVQSFVATTFIGRWT